MPGLPPDAKVARVTWTFTVLGYDFAELHATARARLRELFGDDDTWHDLHIEPEVESDGRVLLWRGTVTPPDPRTMNQVERGG